MASPAGPGIRDASQKAAAGLLAAFLLVLPFTSSAALRNAFLALAGLCVLYGAARGRLPRPRLPSWRVLAPIAAYGAWGIASVAWSVDPAYSISELRPELLYPLVAFLVFHAATQHVADIDRWAFSLSAGLGILGVAALAQVVLTGWWDPPRWHGDVGSYATHIVLALPLLAWAFLRAGSAVRAALAAVAALTLAVALWTDNRIIWLALGGMTVFSVILGASALSGRQRSRAIAFAAVATLAFSSLFILSVQQRSSRLEASLSAAEAKLAHDPRVAIWKYTAGRVFDSPWIGHGFGRGILRQDIRTGAVPGVDNPLYTHGHNTVLNVALQGGAVGLALFAWMLAALVRELVAGLANAPPRRDAAVLGLVLFAGFAIRNQTDDFLVRHSALLAWALAGAVLGALRPGPGPTSARTPA
jgi:O-antigen ligase